MPVIKPVSDLRNYTEAVMRLFFELLKGQKAGEQQGWATIEDVETVLGVNTGKKS